MSGDKRYEIVVLVGPCSYDEADGLAGLVADLTIGRLGAVVSLQEYDEAANSYDEAANSQEPSK